MGKALINTRALKIYRTRWREFKYGPHFCYAEKNGGGVIKGDTSWKKINGIFLVLPHHHIFLTFRRHVKY